MNKAFEENNFRELIKTDPERQREIARAGGIKSGQTRREKNQKSTFYSYYIDALICRDFAISEQELKEFRRWKKRKEQRKKKRRVSKMCPK